MNLPFLGDKIISLQKDRSHTKSTTHCLAARSNINSDRHLRISSFLSVTASVFSLFTGDCLEHLFLVIKKKEVENCVQVPFPQCQTLFKGSCHHPSHIYDFMEGTWTWDDHCCHSPAGAVPPFLPSLWSCLVPKSIESSVTSWASPNRVCSAASPPKLNIPAP